jgi:hypothetical protein
MSTSENEFCHLVELAKMALRMREIAAADGYHELDDLYVQLEGFLAGEIFKASAAEEASAP